MPGSITTMATWQAFEKVPGGSNVARASSPYRRSSSSRCAWKWTSLASSGIGMAARASPRMRAVPSASSTSAGLASSRDAATFRSWLATISAPRPAAPPPMTIERLPQVPQP